MYGHQFIPVEPNAAELKVLKNNAEIEGIIWLDNILSEEE